MPYWFLYSTVLPGNVVRVTGGAHTGITIEAFCAGSAALAAVTVQLVADEKLGSSLVGAVVLNLHAPPCAGAVTTCGAAVVVGLASVHPPVTVQFTLRSGEPSTSAYTERTDPGIAARSADCRLIVTCAPAKAPSDGSIAIAKAPPENLNRRARGGHVERVNKSVIRRSILMPYHSISAHNAIR